MIELLRGVVEHGTGQAASMPGGVAGKTGTSQGYRDAWFIGFTDELVVGVWVGNDHRSPMKGVTGGSLPARIWNALCARPRLCSPPGHPGPRFGIRRGDTGAGRGAGKLRRRCLRERLPLVRGVGLHVPALSRPAPGLREDQQRHF